MYPQHPYARFARFRRFQRLRLASKAARAGLRIIRAPTATSPLRSTPPYPGLNARSVEQPVNFNDGDDAFNYPWMNAGEMGDWKLTGPQIDCPA